MGFLSKLIGTDKAARRITRATEASTAEQQAMFERMWNALEPYREAGVYGVNQLQRLLEEGPGEFTGDPGYRFRVGEGTKSIERSAAARGGLLSGRTGKALTRYGQDVASGEYQNFLNRYYQKLNPYMALAGTGQQATTTGAGMGMQTAQNVGQNYLAGGQARASAYMAPKNFLMDVAGKGLNALILSQYLKGG